MVGGELKSYMRTPGVTHNYGPRPAKCTNRPSKVIGNRHKIIPIVRLIRKAMTALVDRGEAKVGC
jgi:hypothetical protein